MPLPRHIGRYEILDVISEGGLSTVVRARDPFVDRLVAIKLLTEGFDSAELRERFMREARSAGRLHHTNIVTIFDVGEHEKQPFIVMEYVEGETLHALIRRKAALSISQRLQLMDELAAGLQYAHEHGIVHRDITPADIMVDGEGTLKILSIGIARVSDSGGTTNAGMVVGVLNYLAPEQIEGLPHIDARADQFSAGAVFYELLVYRQAFAGGLDTGILHRIITAPPEPLLSIDPKLDRGIVALVDKCLEKSRENRYPDMATVRRDLASLRRRLAVDDEQKSHADTLTEEEEDATIRLPKPVVLPAPLPDATTVRPPATMAPPPSPDAESDRPILPSAKPAPKPRSVPFASVRSLLSRLLNVIGYDRSKEESQDDSKSAELEIPQPSEIKDRGKSRDRGRFVRIPVWYATDRAATGLSAPSDVYSNARSASDAYELGRCEVSIPFRHSIGTIERPRMWRMELQEDPERHIVILSTTPLSEKDFCAGVNQAAGNAPAREQAFVFIHGYNVSFADAIRRTGQLAHDLKFRGAAIAFTWPAEDHFLRYTVAEGNALWVVPHFEAFLKMLAQRLGVTTIHLIGHSLGNRIMATALERLSLSHPERIPMFHEVVLTAPDIDLGVFKQIAEELKRCSRHVTLYVSATDQALLASAKLHAFARVGLAPPDPFVCAGIDTIDASSVDTSFLGHSYAQEARDVLSDLYPLLKEGKLPSDRFALRPTESGYWEFKP